MIDTREELINIVGADSLLDDEETLQAYSKDESFAHPLKPWYVVKVRDADQIQKLVQWANRTATPLVPVSSGPPHFRGDTVPSVPGTVIVDLSQMKRIYNIDRRNRAVAVEPGVTYTELQPLLTREGLRLSTPLLPRSNKSVVASLLEREPITITRFQWTALDPLRSTEIVWGDGERFRTGDASNWPSVETAMSKKQSGIGGAGPFQVDFYRLASGAQGSLGIVTWASLKCEVLPEVHKLYFVGAQKLDGLLDFFYKILRYRFADELFILNSHNLASIVSGDMERIQSLKAELPPWSVLVGIAGRAVLARERVEFQEKDIAEIAQQMGLKLVPALSGAINSDILQSVLNTSPEPYWKLNYKGAFQDIFFVTTADRTPDFLRIMYSTAESAGYPVSDIGVYIQPMHQGVNCHCEFTLPYDRDNAREAARMNELFTLASEKILQEGAYFSRPYGIWANMSYNRNAQATMALKKVKGIFDPNNVMNPGKLCF
ncbi:MAG: FAD-binding oxidoreductase [Dehalococcoidales bacterium]|nr:FAD-binding oxidoreductase [Dehalococcoidales bacterium]